MACSQCQCVPFNFVHLYVNNIQPHQISSLRDVCYLFSSIITVQENIVGFSFVSVLLSPAGFCRRPALIFLPVKTDCIKTKAWLTEIAQELYSVFYFLITEEDFTLNWTFVHCLHFLPFFLIIYLLPTMDQKVHTAIIGDGDHSIVCVLTTV